MLKIGYIGNGKSTNRYHAPFVLQRPDKIKIVSIYDRHVATPKWEHIDGVKYTDNIEEVMGNPEIDLIVVCTSSMHYEYTMMALEHHKHVLVEKPFTNTYAQAKEIFDKAKSLGLIAQCYQNRRFDSDFLTVQKVIEGGKLGDLLEVEMHFDYYRPEIPESIQKAEYYQSYLYGHGCHTIDQVISYFGMPNDVKYDVRCLLGKGRFNDYFDVDMYYGNLKVSVKSSYFRVKSRPSFVVYGKKGMFTKESKDRQEEHLKLFYMPTHKDFGIDLPEHYGTLIYMDEQQVYHEEKVPSVNGDYGRIYDGMYEAIVNGKPKIVKDEETLRLMEILENGAKKAYE